MRLPELPGLRRLKSCSMLLQAGFLCEESLRQQMANKLKAMQGLPV